MILTSDSEEVQLKQPPSEKRWNLAPSSVKAYIKGPSLDRRRHRSGQQEPADHGQVQLGTLVRVAAGHIHAQTHFSRGTQRPRGPSRGTTQDCAKATISSRAISSEWGVVQIWPLTSAGKPRKKASLTICISTFANVANLYRSLRKTSMGSSRPPAPRLQRGICSFLPHAKGGRQGVGHTLEIDLLVWRQLCEQRKSVASQEHRRHGRKVGTEHLGGHPGLHNPHTDVDGSVARQQDVRDPATGGSDIPSGSPHLPCHPPGSLHHRECLHRLEGLHRHNSLHRRDCLHHHNGLHRRDGLHCHDWENHIHRYSWLNQSILCLNCYFRIV